MLIVYCKTCGRRVSDAEISAGKARQVDENEYVCSDCAVPIPQPAATAPARRPTSSGSPTQARPQRITKQFPARKSGQFAETARSSGSESSKQKLNSMLPIIGASVCVIVIGIGILLLSGGAKSQQIGAKKSIAPEPEAPKTIAPTPVKLPDTPTAPPIAKTPQSPASTLPVQPPRDPGAEMEDLRNDLAAGKLRDAKEFAVSHPSDPWAYKEKLEALVGTYRSTPAGNEAQGLLANLKVPEKPAPAAEANANADLPAGSGDWKVIIGPNNFEGISSDSRNGWVVVNGAVERNPKIDNAAQSAAVFGDGEFRVRFEVSKVSSFFFSAHQGAEGNVGVHLYHDQLEHMEGKQHELVITCAGDQFKATLDGALAALEKNGTPRHGKMQFNSHEGTVRILAIEFRPLAGESPAPQTNKH